MTKETYIPGEMLQEAANRLFTHLHELAMDLKSIKSAFPESPIVESEDATSSITWRALDQLPTNLAIDLSGWGILQNDDSSEKKNHQQEIQIVMVLSSGDHLRQ